MGGLAQQGYKLCQPRAQGDQQPPQVESQEINRQSMLFQFKVCVRDSVFMFNMLSSSLIIIFIFVFTSILGQLVYPFGVTSDKLFEQMGFNIYTVGIIGAVISAMVLAYFPYLILSNYLIIGFTIVSWILFDIAMHR